MSHSYLPLLTFVTGFALLSIPVDAQTVGAKTPFSSYEAESGTLRGGASVVSLTSPPATKFSSPELEASGHAYVHLGDTGQSVTWKNTTGKNITAINVRYSIPDSATGGGITSTLDLYVNGVFRQTIGVNSKQTWVYESDRTYDGFSQDTSAGHPHVFWDETHTFVKGAPIAPGSTIALKKDSSNTADYYNIDVIDVEDPPAPLVQPANALSITSFGAVANDISVDSTSAIQNCFDAAQAQGKSVWIPQGKFYLNSSRGLNPKAITIQGAGMWYSTIYYNVPLPAKSTNNVFLPVSCTLRNFAIDGDAVDNSPSGGNGGAINIKGSNWLIDSLWISHEGAGVWADGTNGVVQNCRFNNTWADGINLNNGNTGNTGDNLTARNNFVRGSGDDGLAINDDASSFQMHNISLINNTVVAPWWANNIGIYGGSNDIVENNLVMDSVKEYGISIGIFGGGGGPIEGALFQNNVLLRGGSHGYGNQYPGMGIGVTGPIDKINKVIVRGNKIAYSMFDGVHLLLGDGVIVDGNRVNTPNHSGFVVESSAKGSAYLTGNTVLNLNAGQSAYINNAPTNFTVTGSGNTGFSVP